MNETFSTETELDLTGDVFEAVNATFEITDVEVKDTKAGTGSYARVEFESIEEVDGQMGLKVNENYNLSNPNDQAVRIGRRDLRKLLLAATGSPNGTLDSLVGQFVSGRVSEDDNGFRRLKSIVAVSDDTAEEVSEPAFS